MKYPVTLALALMAASCMKQPPQNAELPESAQPLSSFLQKATDAQIRNRAVKLAQEDVRAGKPRIAWCGTIGLHRPNIPPDTERFVADLPSLNLPAGCTNPLAMKGATFAMAYNGELVKHLPLKKPR